MNIDYKESIPNNVNLEEDRRLQRALEKWRPMFFDWWRDMGPSDSADMDIYLRTAISVESSGWANFDHVRMPDYRWGIFLAPAEEGRKINFGMHKGRPAWQQVPGEGRAELRRLIVTQGDTEPASVEQQRKLGKTAPSLYDLRNLFQVNVEEGRHLWAMVYLLHAHFGRDGREEAEALLERHSGDADKPRILDAFNEETPEWLSFFMFTYFTDRDGKYQLAALAESGFDPLSRTCRFMLIEEAHHMFVGETGVGRVVKRACDIMCEQKTGEVRKFGGIDLPTVQKYLNFHYSVSMDLFGQELSTNAANYYTMGIKGRYRETEIEDDHVLIEDSYRVPEIRGNSIVTVDAPALKSINVRLRDDYVVDCQRGLDKWNKIIRNAGVDFELKLPDQGFNRTIGTFGGVKVSPAGKLLDADEWNRLQGDWLPTEDDRAFIKSLMGPVTEPGKFAGWIAPPAKGIYGQPLDFDYVRFN